MIAGSGPNSSRGIRTSEKWALTAKAFCHTSLTLPETVHRINHVGRFGYFIGALERYDSKHADVLHCFDGFLATLYYDTSFAPALPESQST